jgi:hypothetical protein
MVGRLASASKEAVGEFDAGEQVALEDSGCVSGLAGVEPSPPTEEGERLPGLVAVVAVTGGPGRAFRNRDHVKLAEHLLERLAAFGERPLLPYDSRSIGDQVHRVGQTS